MTRWHSTALFVSIATILMTAATHGATLPEQGHDYDRCMRLAREKPVDGMETAIAWENAGGGHAARHCAAVAMIGMGDLPAAGDRLESLAWDLPAETPDPVRAQILAQAGRVWLDARKPDKAHALLSAAVELAPRDPEIRIERAITRAGMSRYQDAIIDLSAALVADRDSVDALVLRANAYRESGRTDAALADIERALALAPDRAEALLERGVLRRLAGDAAGARADWHRLIQLYPGQASAQAARHYLDEGPRAR